MAEDTVVELSKNGTNARVVFAKDIEIKDLWHIAMAIKNGDCQHWNSKDREEIFEKILDVWNIAHHLKDHIIDREE